MESRYSPSLHALDSYRPSIFCSFAIPLLVVCGLRADSHFHIRAQQRGFSLFRLRHGEITLTRCRSGRGYAYVLERMVMDYARHTNSPCLLD